MEKITMEKEELIKKLKELPKNATVEFDTLIAKNLPNNEKAYLGNPPAELLSALDCDACDCDDLDNNIIVAEKTFSTTEIESMFIRNMIQHATKNAIAISEEIIKFNRAKQQETLNIMCHIIDED